MSQTQSVATFSNNSHLIRFNEKKTPLVLTAVTSTQTKGKSEPEQPPVLETSMKGTKPKQQRNVIVEKHLNDSPKISSTLPPLKKKSVTVKETVPPPVPPRGSPRSSGSKDLQNLRTSYEFKSQNVSTGKSVFSK